MEKLLFIFLSLNLCACTSYYPLKNESGDVQTQVREGSVIQAGDRIRVVTHDQQQHELVVASVTTRQIIGEDQVISIDDIAEVKIRRTSAGKTTFLTLGILIVGGAAYAARDFEGALRDAISGGN